jgi:hypothetical protein
LCETGIIEGVEGQPGGGGDSAWIVGGDRVCECWLGDADCGASSFDWVLVFALCWVWVGAAGGASPGRIRFPGLGDRGRVCLLVEGKFYAKIGVSMENILPSIRHTLGLRRGLDCGMPMCMLMSGEFTIR